MVSNEDIHDANLVCVGVVYAYEMV